LVNASNLLGAKVVDKENKKIGLLVNIVFRNDPDIPDAKVLIFPDKPRKWLNRLSEFIKGTTLDIIKDDFPSDYPKIAKDVAEKGSEQAFKIWEKYLNEKEDELMKTYYLVPILYAENPEQDEISEMKMKKNIYELKKFKKCKPSTNEYPFFGDRSFDGLETLLPTNLNLVSIEGLKIKYLEGTIGRLIDLQLDFEGGLVEKFIVQTYGPGASQNLVNPKTLNFSELAIREKDSSSNSSDNQGKNNNT
jgi:sporulation protein YlmC with PRC-barrel domain